MIEYSQPRDIDELADTIPDKYLACRVDLHSRTPSSEGIIADMEGVDESIRKMKHAWGVRTLRCRNRCGVRWVQITDDTGAVIWESGPIYDGAPGYLTKGMGRFTREYRNRLRREMILRAAENAKNNGGAPVKRGRAAGTKLTGKAAASAAARRKSGSR